jgi:hypothetical protein
VGDSPGQTVVRSEWSSLEQHTRSLANRAVRADPPGAGPLSRSQDIGGSPRVAGPDISAPILSAAGWSSPGRSCRLPPAR